jgi:hypothetical protein
MQTSKRNSPEHSLMMTSLKVEKDEDSGNKTIQINDLSFTNIQKKSLLFLPKLNSPSVGNHSSTIDTTSPYGSSRAAYSIKRN